MEVESQTAWEALRSHPAFIDLCRQLREKREADLAFLILADPTDIANIARTQGGIQATDWILEARYDPDMVVEE